MVKFLSCGTSCVEIETDLTVRPRVGDLTTFQEIRDFEGTSIVIEPLALKTLEEYNIEKLTFDVGVYWWSKPLCLLENPRKYAPRIEGYCSEIGNDQSKE
ncbi:MAG: hypothetical protein HWN65_22805 [Candidatus Helarchaeota archaeon]|nr:hypothetical protein [Candidatus Helarchaeota archaeon]